MSGYVPTPAEARLVDEMLGSELFMSTAPDETGLREPFAHEDEAVAVQQGLLGGAR